MAPESVVRSLGLMADYVHNRLGLLADALVSLLQRPEAWIVVAVSTGLYLIVSAVTSYRRLSHFKGPPLAAVSGLWMFWHELRGDFAEAQLAGFRKYGIIKCSPLRIAPDLLVTDNADLIRHMNAPSSKWRRSAWYEAMRLDPRHDSVFSTRDEALHAELRAKEASGYNGRDTDSLEADVDHHTVAMLNLIRRVYLDKPMDFADVSRYFVLDVLSTVAFGRPYGFLTANSDLWQFSEQSEAFMGLLELSTNHWFVRAILNSSIMQALAAPKPTDKAGMGRALGFGIAAVKERFKDPSTTKKDMLGSFMRKGLSQTQCEVEAFLQVVAGADSSTTALRSTIYLLAGSPPAYRRLQAEIDAAVSAELVSSPVIKNAEALRLPYLRACIWEALRLYPPLFGSKVKLVPAEGDSFDEDYFPAGTRLGICDDGVCRRVDKFGEDVAFFRPERFLTEDGQSLSPERMRAVEVVFSSGRFTCLGKHIALMELHKSVFELMRTFDFSIANPMVGIQNTRRAVNMQHGMNLIATAR